MFNGLCTQCTVDLLANTDRESSCFARRKRRNEIDNRPLMHSQLARQCRSEVWRFARRNTRKFVQKRPDEEKETLGFLKWKFSQQILTVLADFSALSVDFRAEHGGEENFVFLA